jgi:CRISPR-associated protein Csx17
VTNERAVLPVVPVPGLRLDSLGNYLASLGLLRALARARWPNVRGAWRLGVLHMVGGPATMDDVTSALWDVATKQSWTPYDRGWADAQKQSTKKKSGRPLALWQASASEHDLELLSAHAVPASRVSFNPLLGSGGNAGKRDFSDGWRRAVQAIGQASEMEQDIFELKCLLLGQPVSKMIEKLNAACWFSDANKLYNSGQRPYREGAISPWAMALACEGLIFFAGSSSRRLGSRARSVGAFPFATRAAAPCGAGEAGHDLAEVWAPIWERPMTLPEVVTLFSRGRAEAGGRGVLTPSAFATAIVHRGVDAGITEFRRFILGRTTSANTFEPRFEGVFHVRDSRAASQADRAGSVVMQRLLSLADQFVGPLADRKAGQRWRYVGLRGGIEAGMLRLAASPGDAEAGRALLDSVISSLDRVDKNRTFREQNVAWEPLPLNWLPTLLSADGLSVEARLALAAASSFPSDRPFSLYRFGVTTHGHRFIHPSAPPKRWVWRSPVPLSRVLSNVLYRRTLDWETEPGASEPVRLGVPVRVSDVDRWLSGFLDEDLLVRWLSRFALFDWSVIPSRVKSLTHPAITVDAVNGTLCVFGLIQPLFDLRGVSPQGAPTSNLLPHESGARTPAAARRLLGLLRADDLAGAVRLAAARYSMAGTPLLRHDVSWSTGEVDRLTASLLFPICDHDRSVLATRWLRPRRKQGELAQDA